MSDVVCYKAMDICEWEDLVREVLAEKGNRNINFNYEIGESYTTAENVIRCTTILTHPHLIKAMELLSPHYLGSDRDIFDALVAGKNLERGEDDLLICNSDTVKKLWQAAPRQPHKKMYLNDEEKSEDGKDGEGDDEEEG